MYIKNSRAVGVVIYDMFASEKVTFRFYVSLLRLYVSLELICD